MLYTQQSTATIASGNSSVDKTLASNITDLSRAFLLMWSTGPNDSNSIATGYLWNDGGTTKIKFERYGSTLDCSIGYMVVECRNQEFSVQRGVQAFTTAEVTKTLDFGTAVDTQRSLVIVNGRGNMSAGDLNCHCAYFTGEFTNVVANSTDDIILTRGASASLTGTARYEVVEWSSASGVTVQTGEKDCSGDLSSGVTDTIDTAVTPARTWLYTTYRHAVTGLEQTSIRDVLTNGTTITFDRYDETSSYQSYGRWWIIEFPANGVIVEHLTDEIASADATEDTPCTAITLANSYIWAGNNVNGTGNAIPRDRLYWQFTSTTNTRATRVYTGQAAQLAVQTIDTSAWDTSPTGGNPWYAYSQQ